MTRYDNTVPRRAIHTTKDIVAPTERWHTNKGYTAAIRSLEVGWSVWLPTNANTARALAGAITMRQDYRGRKHVVRKEVAPAEGELPEQAGARVWRTA